MPSRWSIGLFMGLVLLCTLAATAPARLLPAFIDAEQVVLRGLNGSLWRGEASRVMVATAGGYLQLGHVRWRLHPLSLLLLSPRLDVDSAWGEQTLQGEVSLLPSGGLELARTEGRVDAALLRHYLPVQLNGNFQFQFDELRVKDGLPVRAEGRLLWEEGGWTSPQGPRPLGTYALSLHTGADAALHGEVVTLAGDLDASGELRWRDGSYSVDILLSGAALDDPQLRQALQLMATPEGEAFRLKLEE